MESRDVVVVGGGVSGLSLAFEAARAGRAVTVVEEAPRVGGCLHSHRLGSGYWFELGAHTCYNSYGGLIDLIDGCALRPKLLPRARVPFKLLKGGQLRSIARELDKWELLRSLPAAFTARKDGQTVYAYYSRLVGRGNYDRVLGPFLSAVPSQSADAFPASMLFKKRSRRKDVLRSFTVDGGLGAIAEAVAGLPLVSVRTGVAARKVERAGDRFRVTLADGSALEAAVAAVAVPPSAAAELLRDAFPEVAAQLARVKMATIETTGVVVPRSRIALEPVAGIVPVEDLFFSAVTRDTVPDPKWRAFAFHFKPGYSAADRLKRAAEVLRVDAKAFEEVAERRTLLPSPVLGHEAVVAELDRLLAGTPLALSGNYFAGLSIEDCVQRSLGEWKRVAGAREVSAARERTGEPRSS